jgi:PAS domain S-box-containing protein
MTHRGSYSAGVSGSGQTKIADPQDPTNLDSPLPVRTIDFQDASLEFLRLQNEIMDHLAEGVCLIRLKDRKLVFVNHRFETLFGYENNELSGQSVNVLLEPGQMTPAELEVDVLKELKDKGVWTGEVRNRKKTGEGFWCRVHTTEYNHPHFGPVWIAVHEDITVRKNLEKELRRYREDLEGLVNDRAKQIILINQNLIQEIDDRKKAQQKYLDLYDNAPDMKVSVDPYTSTILECNRTFLDSMEADKDFVIGRSIFDFYALSCRDSAHEAFEVFLETGELHGEVLSLQTRTGKMIDVSLDASAVRNSEGRILYRRSSYHDITDRLRIEKLKTDMEIAQNSDRLKTEFLAAMSHEVRTPLNSIIGLTEMLLETSLTELQESRLKTVLRSGTSLLSILNDILDFSRIEAGQLEIENIPFHLEDTLQDVLEMFEPEALKKGVSLKLRDLGVDPCKLLGDPVRVKQILMNLVGNAVKYTDQGRVLVSMRKLRSSKNDLTLRFTVTDTGRGIPELMQDNVFESFARLNHGSDRKIRGTGLGLSICKRLVERMNGRIGFESRIGKGSQFWFELSFLKGEGRENKPSPVVSESSWSSMGLQFQAIQILLVEDDPGNQEVAMAMLRSLGCNCHLVDTGEKALDWLGHNHADLVLMDCLLPGMSGVEVTRCIRKHEASKKKDGRLVIIAFTAHAILGEREKCLEAGMDDFLTKPTQKANFEQVLEKWVPHILGGEGLVPPTHLPLDELKLVDEEVLRKIIKEFDMTTAQKIISVYLDESIPKYLELVKDSFEDQNIKDLRRGLHSLISSFGFLGAKPQVELLPRIKAAVLSGDRKQVVELIEKLESGAKSLVIAWKQRLQSMPSLH